MLPNGTNYSVTYGKYSILGSADILNNFINTSLEVFSNDTSNETDIESLLMLQLRVGVSVTKTELQCSIEDLAVADIVVSTNTSGL